MQLYLFYSPGLATGLYKIDIEQKSDAYGQTKTINVPQLFFVTAPRFSIDSSLIHSIFPLPGITAHPNILPHIVFNDPHLPWQTMTSRTSDDDIMRVPWLAVIVFEQSELHVTSDEINLPKDSKQSFTMANNMTLGTLTNRDDSRLHCIIPQDLADDPTTKVDVIFPKKDLFLILFTDSNSSSPSINLDCYKYLAHARQVNTIHMTDSGVISEGTFSIIFSHRSGPQFSSDASLTTPKPCVVHLISLDVANRVPKASLNSQYMHAALVSLFSWTYDCFPSETINFEAIMRAVMNNCKAFRTPKAISDQAGQGLPSAVETRVKARVQDGYTLLRYHVQTGEETVALMCGLLVPCTIPDVTWLNVQSNMGEDLQIIDKELGLIDIMYCAAWQLGKLLAIADQAFCAALLRL
jgi:hypothetical protein